MRNSKVGVSPFALYLDLLEDLSPHLSYDQLVSLQNHQKVEGSSDMTVKQMAALALAQSFLKKYKDETNVEADKAALDKFLAINEKCKDWSLELQNSGEELMYGEFKLAVYNFLYPKQNPLVHNFGQILDLARAGPGSSVGAVGDDFYTKMFSSRLTATSESLHRVYAAHFSNHPSWSTAENLRQAVMGEVEVVRGNRLSFVPKNADISRTICIEPSLNMYYQLGFGAILERRLNQFFGIDLSIQPDRNRELARIGSLDLKGDGITSPAGLVTIDLSSASDSISMPMLRHALPAPFVGWLELLRSPEVALPNGCYVPLNMVSTMGNGFTFPLQTMLFGCAVIAVARTYYREVENPSQTGLGSFGVFGDDIICEKLFARRLVRLLNILGFEVNDDKSFYEGPFRESCGFDYFRGQNVRGVYVKTLRSSQARYAMINQLNLWTARVGIPLPRSVGRLLRSVRYLPVPVWENDDAGIRVTYRNLTRMKYSRNLSLIYKRWVPSPKRIRIGDGMVHVPKGLKPRIYNPEGLLQAFLHGSIAHGYITVRQRHVRYSVRKGVAPSWDTTPTGSALRADLTLSNFGWAVAVNTAKTSEGR